MGFLTRSIIYMQPGTWPICSRPLYYNTTTLPEISTSVFFFALSRMCETTKQKSYPTPSTFKWILTCNLQPATCNLQPAVYTVRPKRNIGDWNLAKNIQQNEGETAQLQCEEACPLSTTNKISSLQWQCIANQLTEFEKEISLFTTQDQKRIILTTTNQEICRLFKADATVVCLSNRIKIMLVIQDQNVEEWYLCTELPYLCPNYIICISKVQYICPKLRYVYPNPATCFRFIYNRQMILHISIQFRYTTD